jgi:hypothetical protein
MSAPSRSIGIAVLALLSGACGIKEYDTFEAGAGEYSETTLQEGGFDVAVSAVCDPKGGGNSFFFRFTSSTTDSVQLADVVVKESLAYRDSVKEVSASCFRVSGLVRHGDDWSRDEHAEAASVAGLPSEFLLLQPRRDGAFTQLSFDGDSCVSASNGSPRAVALEVSFVTSQARVMHHVTQTIRLRRTPHHYLWFVRDC